MTLIEIDDPEDDRLADYVRLRDVSLRRRLETENGLFIAEGEKVIHRAVAAGYRPRSFLLAERWLASLEDVLSVHPDVPVYVVSEAMAEQVTGFHVHRGALASLHREVRHGVDDLLAMNGRARLGRCALGAPCRRSVVPEIDQGGHGRGVRSAVGSPARLG